jgi:hypothetical protein
MSLMNTNTEEIRSRLKLFMGGSGGVDNWLAGISSDAIVSRIASLDTAPLSCSQMNQLLALSHQAELSEGAFRYYWLSKPQHSYDVTALPHYHPSYAEVDRILSLDQLVWGLYRLYFDSLLYYGTIRNGYRTIRSLTFEELEQFFNFQRFPGNSMVHRGPALPLEPINQDDRYLIAEQACKSFEPSEGDEDMLLVLKGAWQEHLSKGGGKITAKALLNGAYVLSEFPERQGQFLFAADELLESEIGSEEELIKRYELIRYTFGRAREAALRNTELYLSMANDLDVYVATSMRTREQFRYMARFCDSVFSHAAVQHLNLRYFDPTLSAARGHEDKGLIECLMVKCAKVLIYTAGERDSYGKDAEAAMALSLGKPVIFYCDAESKRKFFSEVHPLSRLIDFKTGVAVGAMATSSVNDVAVLLGRICENKMEYDLEQPRLGYLRLKERLTGSTVRLQTADELLRETFWNCYNRPPLR